MRRLNIFLLILSLTFVLMGSSWTSQVSANGVQELDRNVNQILQFAKRDSKNPYRVNFDEHAAKEKGASAKVTQMGRMLEQFSRVYATSQLTGGKIAIPIYGNWCGPGHDGGEPIDHLDKRCMEHDLCYKEKGDYNCECDQQLIAGIREDYPEMKPKEKVMATIIVAYFTVAPCKEETVYLQ